MSQPTFIICPPVSPKIIDCQIIFWSSLWKSFLLCSSRNRHVSCVQWHGQECLSDPASISSTLDPISAKTDYRGIVRFLTTRCFLWKIRRCCVWLVWECDGGNFFSCLRLVLWIEDILNEGWVLWVLRGRRRWCHRRSTLRNIVPLCRYSCSLLISPSSFFSWASAYRYL